MHGRRVTRVAFWVDNDDLARLRKLTAQNEITQSKMFKRGLLLAISYYEEREGLIQKGLDIEDGS